MSIVKQEFKFSIIIPCYNSFSNMTNCLNCLENQTYKNFEVIIIDDYSTDGSYENLEKYIKNSKLNIKLLKNDKNLGAGLTRNKGIIESIGDYILFIDSDDYICFDTLKIFNDILIKNNSIDCVCFDYFKVINNKEKNRISMIEGYNNDCFLDTKNAFIKVKGCTCGKLYASRVIKEKNVFFTGSIRNEDMPFTKVAVSYCNNIYYYKQSPLYYYVMNSKSLMHNKNLANENYAIHSFKYIKENVNKEFESELEIIFISECLYSVICIACLKKYNSKKIKEIKSNICNEYPKWYQNEYIKYLNLYKRIIFFLIKHNMFFMLKIIFLLK